MFIGKPGRGLKLPPITNIDLLMKNVKFDLKILQINEIDLIALQRTI